VEDARPRGRPKRTWTEVVQKDCQACKLNREDAMDHNGWRKLLDDQDRCEWYHGMVPLMVQSHPGSPKQRAIK